MADEPAARRSARRLRASLGLALSALLGLVPVILAVCGPWLALHQVGEPVGRPFLGSGPGIPFGTDHLGRDVWSQVLHGGRTMVLVPILATLAAGVVGAAIGLLAGYRQGLVSRGVGRLLDILIALPAILVLLVLVNGWGSSVPVLVAIFVLTSAPYAVRYARAATLRVITVGYVDHAVAMGERRLAIVWREILPNVAGPLLADAGQRLVGGIYIVASASFLGFGRPPPATDWAQMISENLEGGNLNPWSIMLPALLIAALAVSVNLLADHLDRWIAK